MKKSIILFQFILSFGALSASIWMKPLKAAFYAFIPNHNIQNLYKEYVKK